LWGGARAAILNGMSRPPGASRDRVPADARRAGGARPPARRHHGTAAGAGRLLATWIAAAAALGAAACGRGEAGAAAGAARAGGAAGAERAAGAPDAAAAAGATDPTGAAGPAGAGAERGTRFAASPLWDDGNAEVSAYEAAVRRYGVPRPFTAYLIVVKEDFSRTQLVKADPGHDPADLVTVLKLNQILEFQTGIYSYNQMASTFHERVTMDLLKLTLASFEWCGNTFKEYTRRGGRGTLHVRTYWDGQARADYELPVAPDVLFYDELPLRLRALPQAAGTSLIARLVPTQIDSRGPKPELRAAQVRAAAEEILIVPAGSFRALRWDVKTRDAVDTYWLDRNFPHVLLAWDRPDGSSFRLRWTQRLPYWKLNRPGDERYLQGPRGGAAPQK
jgi:hypothetical protein